MTFLIIALHTIGDDMRFRCVRWLVDFSVPTFFTISAYLYFQKFELTFACYWKKIVSRFYSLYIPFVLFNALYIPYFILKTRFLHIENTREVSMDFIDMVGSIFLGYPTVLNGPLWFIKALLIFTLFAPVIGFCLTKKRSLFILLFIAGFILSFYTHYFHVLYWIPCFVIGCYAALYENDVLHIMQKMGKMIPAKHYTVLLFLFYVVWSYFILYNQPYDSFFYYCHRIMAPLLVIVIYSVYKGILPESFVKKIYPYTFFIYCTHTFFIYFSEHVFTLLIPSLNIYKSKLFVFVISSVLVVLFAVIVSYIKPVWIVLNGFRVRR